MYDYNGTEWNTVYSGYTITYTTTTGEVICTLLERPREEPPELETGDTAALDDFLGEFSHEKK